MNTPKLICAMKAWQLAIEEKFLYLQKGTGVIPNVSIKALAEDYGARITDQEHLDIAEGVFNWDVIVALLSEVKAK